MEHQPSTLSISRRVERFVQSSGLSWRVGCLFFMFRTPARVQHGVGIFPIYGNAGVRSSCWGWGGRAVVHRNSASNDVRRVLATRCAATCAASCVPHRMLCSLYGVSDEVHNCSCRAHVDRWIGWWIWGSGGFRDRVRGVRKRDARFSKAACRSSDGGVAFDGRFVGMSYRCASPARKRCRGKGIRQFRETDSRRPVVSILLSSGRYVTMSARRVFVMLLYEACV